MICNNHNTYMCTCTESKGILNLIMSFFQAVWIDRCYPISWRS